MTFDRFITNLNKSPSVRSPIEESRSRPILIIGKFFGDLRDLYGDHDPEFRVVGPRRNNRKISLSVGFN